MHIRRFEIGDESALFGIFYSAIHRIAARDYTAEQIQAWAPADLDQNIWRERMRCIRPFIAQIDGCIVGYADLQDHGYIDHFFVSGFHPRQGIGNALMARIHEEATKRGIRELSADVSRTAQPFFESHGFLIVELRTPIQRGVVVPNALMRKTTI
ncbi:GNAT family N-acetyltransferase [Achromobacter aloeverae]|uniref:GNAT family N-acetyltransferase n=1 Tax=Achromobacter aloeverae TaxID=1750518 RepID=A0A4Q1HFR0_9BURK|nr:GNAT family N-acetyltransferase [Achromobacter aloeverae]RXN85943.1 GNAT family N-acetyltransferase [Achromobacter aloeverae]